MSIAAKVIDYSNIINLMGAIKWDINDLMSQHNQYVDILLRHLQVRYFKMFKCCLKLCIFIEIKNNIFSKILKPDLFFVFEGCNFLLLNFVLFKENYC